MIQFSLSAIFAVSLSLWWDFFYSFQVKFFLFHKTEQPFIIARISPCR